MEVVRASFWAVILVTAVTSKPICLHVEEDLSNSSESRESMSSEETDFQLNPSQPVFIDTAMQTDHLTSSPSPTLDTAALPTPEDPQTSTDFDPSQLNPCQTAFHIDISHDTAGDCLDAAVMKPKGPSTNEVPQQKATPSTPVQVIPPTPLLFSTDTPLVIPAEDTTAETSDGFTTQLTNPVQAPPRGDSR